MAAPRVSILTATDRRPLVLRHAIASLLAQDMPEWELIVVGDGWTDDTEAVVRGFADPRIRWVNLPADSGGQSAPNHEGVRLARALVLAFLNQDDMWFPDHLSRGLGFLDRSGADLVWCPVLLVRKADGAEGPPDPERDILSLDGVPPEGRWRPDLFVIASSWLLRREAASRAGPWRAAEETRISPCQDWLFRGARAGLAFAFHPCPRSSASMRARGPAPTGRACRPSMNGSPPGSRTGMRPGWRRCRRQRCARRRTWHGPPEPGPWHACATPWPRGFGVHPTAIAAALRGHGRGHATRNTVH